MFIQVYQNDKMVDRFMVRNPRVAIGSVWSCRGKSWKVIEITHVDPQCICVVGEEVENA